MSITSLPVSVLGERVTLAVAVVRLANGPVDVGAGRVNGGGGRIVRSFG